MPEDPTQHQHLYIFRHLFQHDIQLSTLVVIFNNSNINQQLIRADEYKFRHSRKLIIVSSNRIMATVKKILPYLLTSVAVIILWRLFTLTENFAWSPKGKERLMLDIALTNIFIYKAIFWLVLANLVVFAIITTFKKNFKSTLVAAAIGVTYYFVAGQVVDKNCAFSYYMVFVNQSVAEGYLQDPIEEAGYYIGPILTENIKDKHMKLRRYAINGLGDIKYKPATKTLQHILLDRTETDYVRADAYVALIKFNTATSKKIITEFNSVAVDAVDKYVVELGEYFLQSN